MKLKPDWTTYQLFVVITVIVLGSVSPNNAQQLNQEQQQPEPSIRRNQNAKLFYSKECQDDITRYCRKARNTELSDLAVLQCIYNEVPDLNAIDKECHNVFNFEF